MDTAQLSEIIAQVLKRLNTADSEIIEKRKALVIFEDLQNGLSIPEDFKQFTEGYNVSLLTVKSNAGMITPEGIERILAIEDLSSNCNIWVRQFERVLVPSPSLRLVSRIAHIILDDKFTEIIFSALQEGRQVLMGQASDNEKAVNFTAQLKIEIQRLAGKLNDYGIEQLSAKKSLKNCSPMTKDIICKTGGVLSLNDVAGLAGNSNELSIGAGTVITPLAMDYIREKKISLNRKS